MDNQNSNLGWQIANRFVCQWPLERPLHAGRSTIFALTLIVAILVSSIPLTAQQSPSQQPAIGSSILEKHESPGLAPASVDAGEDIDKLLTRLVLDNIPHDFDETKDWGGQAERWDGVKFYRDGSKIETRRRKKMVNHGTWKKYSARLRDPANEFTVQLKNMRETTDEKLAFDIHFLAHLDLAGRQSQWVKGVQLYSIGAKGHAKVRLVVSIELEVKMSGLKFPPDIVFVPTATAADLVIDEFRLDRIGKAGGEFAQQVTKGVRSKLDEKVDEKKEKLLEKINKQLTDQRDELRISIADAMMSKWAKATRVLLPASVEQAIEK